MASSIEASASASPFSAPLSVGLPSSPVFDAFSSRILRRYELRLSHWTVLYSVKIMFKKGENVTFEFCFEAWDKVLEFVFFECCYYVCGLNRLFAFELGVFV